MKAMVLNEISDLTDCKMPLDFMEMPVPVPGAGELAIEVKTCGVCHTELDEIEGRTPPPVLPVIPGHQVVGRVVQIGAGSSAFNIGDRVGVAWIHWACGHCKFCQSGMENLCRDFKATGRDVHGGYAEFMTVPESFAYRIPATISDAEAAPLLCAGAIGYRSLALAGLINGQNLGLTGFGASAHLVLKMVKHKYPDSGVFVFARSPKEREFALELGADWAGDTAAEPPLKPDAIIDTTPVWKPVLEALRFLEKGGRLVINAIRKESADQEYLLNLDYPQHLWLEKEIKSVANVTRQDVSEFLELAAEIPIKPDVEEYPLEAANAALMEIKEKKIRGAKVLRVSHP